MAPRASLYTAVGFLAASQAYVMPDGKTGRVPTLGWNSWNAYHCEITEDKFLAAAQALKDKGLVDAGYNYVNIDDCWSEKTGRVDGHIAVNKTRFPDGIDGLAKKIHDQGLKIGIYSTAGTLTCGGYPASLEYEDVDAADFASWGIDYLKYDNCNIPSNWTDQYIACDQDYAKTGTNGTCPRNLNPNLAPDGYDWSTSKSAERFNRMRDALAKQQHEILFSMCIWGTADVFSWGNDTGVNWRMSNDINPSWGSVSHILNMNSFRLNSVGFWGHNDMDMLEVGNGDLTAQETRSHFAFWAAMKSPLLIGTDLTVLSDDNVNILKNKYLLAFNQDDKYGAPATPFKWGTNPDWTYNDTNPAEYWSGKSKNGHLVLMLNTLADTQKKSVSLKDVPGLDGKCRKVTDVWSGKDLGCLEELSADVDSHDTAAFLVGDACTPSKRRHHHRPGYQMI